MAATAVAAPKPVFCKLAPMSEDTDEFSCCEMTKMNWYFTIYLRDIEKDKQNGLTFPRQVAAVAAATTRVLMPAPAVAEQGGGVRASLSWG